MYAFLRASLPALRLQIELLRRRLEIHLLLELQLLPHDSLALPELWPLLPVLNLAGVVGDWSTLALGILLLLLNSFAALLVVSGQAQHLVQEVRLLFLVAVDVAAEILQYAASILGLDAGRCLSGWREVRIVG